MSEATHPSGLNFLWALLSRAVAAAVAVPYRDRAFWVTQALVVGAVGIHLMDDLLGGEVARVPAVVTLVLLVVPVGYAAIRFGLRGSLPTASLTAVLMLFDILLIDSGLERWTDGSVLILVMILAVAAGRTVDLEHTVSASRVAGDRVRRIARVADQLLEGLCVTDLSGVITYANPAWASMQGLTSAGSAVGRPLASFHGDEEPDGDPLPYQLPLGDGSPVHRLVRHHPPGRAEYLGSVTSVALLDERGRAIGRLSTVRDVTAETRAAAALQEAEERFRLTFEQAPLGMALITPEGDFLQVNEALCRGLGRSAQEVLQLGMWALTDRADHEAMRLVLQQQATGGRRFTQRHLHADGRVITVDGTTSLVHDAAGRPLYFVAQFKDVTEERAMVAALQEAEERFRATFEQAPVGMALVTMKGQFLQVNEALCQILGRNVADLMARGVLALLAPEDVPATEQLLRDGGFQTVSIQHALHKDGHSVSLRIRSRLVSDAAGKPLYYVSQIRDVTEEHLSRLQLAHQAFHDSLTGLPNRVLFEERAGRALARTRRQHSVVAIMFCDLDDFKEVNDRFGHQAGDDTLRAVAARFQGCIRETDTVARFGGDEFVFLLDGLSEPAEVDATAARIHEAMRPPHAMGDQEVVIGVSIGIAISSLEVTSVESLMEAADTAMYDAKAAGGGRTSVFGRRSGTSLGPPHPL